MRGRLHAAPGGEGRAGIGGHHGRREGAARHLHHLQRRAHDDHDRCHVVEGTGGASVTTITGADTTSAQPAGGFIAQTAGKLTIRGLTISGNRVAGTAATTGGAIAVDGGEFVMERSVLRGNRNDVVPATNGAGGGAIGSNTGVLSITDSAIEDNVYAGGSPGAILGAGGVMAANALGAGTTIIRSLVSRNRVDPASGTTVSVTGGVYASDGTALTIIDSTVSRNSAAASSSTVRVGVSSRATPRPPRTSRPRPP